MVVNFSFCCCIKFMPSAKEGFKKACLCCITFAWKLLGHDVLTIALCSWPCPSKRVLIRRPPRRLQESKEAGSAMAETPFIVHNAAPGRIRPHKAKTLRFRHQEQIDNPSKPELFITIYLIIVKISTFFLKTLS